MFGEEGGPPALRQTRISLAVSESEPLASSSAAELQMYVLPADLHVLVSAQCSQYASDVVPER